MSTDDAIRTFRDLHVAGSFVMPNAWDAGSAVALASLGFRALATSSAALAFARGRPDRPSSIGLETTLDNVREVVRATRLPVNADFQAGYGATPDAVAANVRRCVEAGAAGLSIEDATGEAGRPLYELGEALDRLRAAREAIDASGRPVVLTARAETFLVGHPRPLESALERLVAFAETGADCLFAPGVRLRDDVTAIVEAVAPKPVNVLVANPAWMTAESLAELGVRRVSVGSALARVAWAGFLAAARSIATSGSFRSLEGAAPFAALDDLFGG